MIAPATFQLASALFPGVKVSPDAARIRLVQTDDSAASFDVEELSARETMAEDLMLACRMTRGISLGLLHKASSLFGEEVVTDACARAVDLGLATWKASDGENTLEGSDGGDELFCGALTPTQRGWLEGNELFGLFWNLA